MTRKEIRKFVGEICTYLASGNLCHFERSIAKEIMEAVRVKDESKVSWFKLMGEDTRHIAHNVNAYRLGLDFGYTSMQLCHYGWLERPEWTTEKEISFRVKEDKACCNSVTIASTPNGSWVYGFNFSYGYAGHSSGPSIYGKRYGTEKECRSAALEYMRNEFEIASKKETQDGNYNTPYIRKILSLVQKGIELTQPLKPSIQQLQLF